VRKNELKAKALITAMSTLVALMCSAREFRFVVVEAESREPMPGVPVSIRLGIPDSREYVPYERTTDTNGICVVRKRRVDTVSVYAQADRTRYFSSLIGLDGRAREGAFVTTVEVHRVINPIPLIVKRQHDSFVDIFAKGNGILQYDFFKGSYLPPAGTGEIADVEFRRLPVEELGLACRTNTKGETPQMRQRETMEVEFLGEDNGVVRVDDLPCSKLKFRTAPTNGYERTYTCQRYDGEHHENIRTWDDGKTLCFRIRTKRNGKGEIVETYYGKIYGDISFGFADEVRIGSPSFLYYLNPNSMDANLEYDGRHNLRPGANRSDYNP